MLHRSLKGEIFRNFVKGEEPYMGGGGLGAARGGGGGLDSSLETRR